MKNKLFALFFLFVILSACERKTEILVAQSVPDTDHFSLFDVLDAIHGSHASGNLADAFAFSDAAKFDPAYGSKDMNPQTLLGFRNYGAIIDPCSLSVGDSYQGGIVAYILVSGDIGYVSGECHGLISATSDQGTNFWHGTDEGGVLTYTNIGTGNTNTNNIITAFGAESNAARRCYDLSLNGYTDWYLPSSNELNQLYNNRIAIGGFANGRYWSSTQAAEVYTTAYDRNFANGDYENYYKSSVLNVRAIRSF